MIQEKVDDCRVVLVYHMDGGFDGVEVVDDAPPSYHASDAGGRFSGSSESAFKVEVSVEEGDEVPHHAVLLYNVVRVKG